MADVFPDARTLATGTVRERATFEATNLGLPTYWHSTFPGEIPDDPVIPGQYDDPVIELEGSAARGDQHRPGRQTAAEE
jgi:hypothetical protein